MWKVSKQIRRYRETIKIRRGAGSFFRRVHKLMYLQMVYTNTSFICYPSVVVFRRKFIPADTHKRSKRKAKQGKTKTFRDPALLSSNPRQLLPLSPDPHSPQHYTLAVDLARNLADRKKQHEHIHTHFQVRTRGVAAVFLLTAQQALGTPNCFDLVCPALFSGT